MIIMKVQTVPKHATEPGGTTAVTTYSNLNGHYYHSGPQSRRDANGYRGTTGRVLHHTP